MKSHDVSKTSQITRREALGLLGVGAAAALSNGFPALEAAEPQFPKGAVIRTVLGDLQPSALAGGTTLFHEHLTHDSTWTPRLRTQGGQVPGPANPPPPRRDPINGCPSRAWEGCDNLTFMVEELKRAKSDGVVCIVDGAHPDGGRDIGFLTEMSRRSGLSVIASGGYYLDWAYPPEVAKMSEDQIAEELIKDATVNPLGAYGEMGTSDEITLNEHKVFRAVSKAHLATNLPIFTHTANGKCAQEQLDIFESMGVKPQRVVIGHLGSMVAPDVEVHKAICQRGAFIGFDRQGGNTDDRNIPMVMKLLEAGYEANLLFSADFGNDAWPNWKQNGGPGVDRALTVWVPKLRKAGVKEDTLHNILVNNPRRFLAFVPKKPRPSGK
jgi:phosphotriesterase-related protein